MMRRSCSPDSPVLSGRGVFLAFTGFFGVIAMVNCLLLYLAIRSWSGAETTSAYRAGQLFNAEKAGAHAQDELGWTLSLTVSRAASDAARIVLVVADRDGRPLSGRTVRAIFQWPTDKRRDRLVEFAETEKGRYEAEASLIAGRWDVVADIMESGERRFRRTQRLLLQ